MERQQKKKANTKKVLTEWNTALQTLHPGIAHKDVPATPLVPYGEAFVDSDRVDIPSMDLPARIPSWMYDNDGWAQRSGTTRLAKRRNITVTVPDGVISRDS